jgi:hypothetical protein
MRFRTGVLVGLAVGYYYGAKAGQERYQQIDAYLERIRGSEAYHDLVARLTALADAGLEQTTMLVRSVTEGDESSRPTSPGPYDYLGDPTLN